MRAMKDSGVEWIGEIPEEWQLEKIKNAVSLLGSGTTPTSYIEDYYDGTVFWIQSGDIYGKSVINDTSVCITKEAVKNIPTLRVYDADFIVIAMYGGSVGNIAISKINACTNQACCVIKPSSDNDLKFMYYWMLLCRNDFLTQAIGGGQPNISQSKIKNQYYAKPSLFEQQSIASFLYRKGAEIDSLTSDIEKQIETLEQYRRSVITEAVTKGLNPNAEMKDSGVEFIGTIPEKWEIRRIKTLGSFRNGLTYSPTNLCDENEGTLVLRSSNIQDGKIDLADSVFVCSEVPFELMVRENDVLICSRNGSVIQSQFAVL